ncbi:hypothetical protein LEN26_014503, partial [Aphanomyces euteiches]
MSKRRGKTASDGFKGAKKQGHLQLSKKGAPQLYELGQIVDIQQESRGKWKRGKIIHIRPSTSRKHHVLYDVSYDGGQMECEIDADRIRSQTKQTTSEPKSPYVTRPHATVDILEFTRTAEAKQPPKTAATLTKRTSNSSLDAHGDIPSTADTSATTARNLTSFGDDDKLMDATYFQTEDQVLEHQEAIQRVLDDLFSIHADVHCVKKALSALLKLLRLAPQVTADFFHFKAGETVLLHIIRSHQLYSVLQCYGFVLLRKMCHLSVDSCSVFVQNGAIPAIGNALRAFPSDPIVQASGCGALAALGQLNPNAIQVMLDQNIATLITAALVNHREINNHTRQVQFYASEVLLELTGRGGANVALMIVDPADDYSTLRALLQVLRKSLKVDDKKVSCAITTLVLCLLTVNKPTAQVLRRLDAISDISIAMAKYPTHEGILKYSLGATRELAVTSMQNSPSTKVRQTARVILEEEPTKRVKPASPASTRKKIKTTPKPTTALPSPSTKATNKKGTSMPTRDQLLLQTYGYDPSVATTSRSTKSRQGSSPTKKQSSSKQILPTSNPIGDFPIELPRPHSSSKLLPLQIADPPAPRPATMMTPPTKKDLVEVLNPSSPISELKSFATELFEAVNDPSIPLNRVSFADKLHRMIEKAETTLDPVYFAPRPATDSQPSQVTKKAPPAIDTGINLLGENGIFTPLSKKLPALNIGTKVKCRFNGGGRYYPGVITRCNADNQTFDVDYVDGEQEVDVPLDFIRVCETPTSPVLKPTTPSAPLFAAGDVVEARYKGKSKYYPGVIARVGVDNQYDINYDDGETETNVTQDLIKLIQKHEEPSSSLWKVGQKVEARYKRRQKYYKSKIARVRLNGTYDIEYDDGEKETNVDKEMIRPLPDLIEIQHFEEGDAVEAQYDGKSRFYPGMITRCRLDGSYDIKYDDGDVETFVAPELIRKRKLPAPAYEVSSRVEVVKGSKSMVGTVTKISSSTGLYTILYDTGEKEKVSVDQIRGTVKDEVFERHQRIEARPPTSHVYSLGLITNCRFNGTYDIEFESGEVAVGVAPSLIRSLPWPPKDSEYYPLWHVGDIVEARYQGKSKYLPGVVARVEIQRQTALYDVHYENGAVESKIPEDAIHLLHRSMETPVYAAGNIVSKNGALAMITWCHMDGTYDVTYANGMKEMHVNRHNMTRVAEDDQDLGGQFESVLDNNRSEATSWFQDLGRSESYDPQPEANIPNETSKSTHDAVATTEEGQAVRHPANDTTTAQAREQALYDEVELADSVDDSTLNCIEMNQNELTTSETGQVMDQPSQEGTQSSLDILQSTDSQENNLLSSCIESSHSQVNEPNNAQISADEAASVLVEQSNNESFDVGNAIDSSDKVRDQHEPVSQFMSQDTTNTKLVDNTAPQEAKLNIEQEELVLPSREERHGDGSLADIQASSAKSGFTEHHVSEFTDAEMSSIMTFPMAPEDIQDEALTNLDGYCPEDANFETNTSSIDQSEIPTALKSVDKALDDEHGYISTAPADEILLEQLPAYEITEGEDRTTLVDEDPFARALAISIVSEDAVQNIIAASLLSQRLMTQNTLVDEKAQGDDTTMTNSSCEQNHQSYSSPNATIDGKGIENKSQETGDATSISIVPEEFGFMADEGDTTQNPLENEALQTSFEENQPADSTPLHNDTLSAEAGVFITPVDSFTPVPLIPKLDLTPIVSIQHKVIPDRTPAIVAEYATSIADQVIESTMSKLLEACERHHVEEIALTTDTVPSTAPSFESKVDSSIDMALPTNDLLSSAQHFVEDIVGPPLISGIAIKLSNLTEASKTSQTHLDDDNASPQSNDRGDESSGHGVSSFDSPSSPVFTLQTPIVAAQIQKPIEPVSTFAAQLVESLLTDGTFRTQNKFEELEVSQKVESEFSGLTSPLPTSEIDETLLKSNGMNGGPNEVPREVGVEATNISAENDVDDGFSRFVRTTVDSYLDATRKHICEALLSTTKPTTDTIDPTIESIYSSKSISQMPAERESNPANFEELSVDGNAVPTTSQTDSNNERPEMFDSTTLSISKPSENNILEETAVHHASFDDMVKPNPEIKSDNSLSIPAEPYEHAVDNNDPVSLAIAMAAKFFVMIAIHHVLETFPLKHTPPQNNRNVQKPSTRPNFVEGQKINCRYKAKEMYYPGVIARVHPSGVYDVDYDDGEKEKDVDESLIRVRETSPHKKPSYSRYNDVERRSHKFHEGEKVEAQFQGKSKFFPGVIVRCRLNGTYDVDYDDGEKELRVAPEWIRSRERPNFMEGDKVECRYKAKEKFYPGVIARVHPSGVYDVDYDDGEKEKDVDESLIRVRETSPHKKPSYSRYNDVERRSHKFHEGEKVEAQFQGKSKFFPGVIVRCRLNGTYDVEYDYGMYETWIPEEMIRLRESIVDEVRVGFPELESSETHYGNSLNKTNNNEGFQEVANAMAVSLSALAVHVGITSVIENHNQTTMHQIKSPEYRYPIVDEATPVDVTEVSDAAVVEPIAAETSEPDAVVETPAPVEAVLDVVAEPSEAVVEAVVEPVEAVVEPVESTSEPSGDVAELEYTDETFDTPSEAVVESVAEPIVDEATPVDVTEVSDAAVVEPIAAETSEPDAVVETPAPVEAVLDVVAEPSEAVVEAVVEPVEAVVEPVESTS